MNRARVYVTVRETGIDVAFACFVCFVAAVLIECSVPIWALILGLFAVIAGCHWVDFDESDIPKDNFPGGPPAAA